MYKHTLGTFYKKLSRYDDDISPVTVTVPDIIKDDEPIIKSKTVLQGTYHLL
jgi:hypothetical protein